MKRFAVAICLISACCAVAYIFHHRINPKGQTTMQEPELNRFGIEQKLGKVQEFLVDDATITIIHVRIAHLPDPLNVENIGSLPYHRVVEACQSECYRILKIIKAKTKVRKFYMDGLTKKQAEYISEKIIEPARRCYDNPVYTAPKALALLNKVGRYNAGLALAFENEFDLDGAEDQKLIELGCTIHQESQGRDNQEIRDNTRKRDMHAIGVLAKTPGTKILFLGAMHDLAPLIEDWNKKNVRKKINLIEVTPNSINHTREELIRIFEAFEVE